MELNKKNKKTMRIQKKKNGWKALIKPVHLEIDTRINNNFFIIMSINGMTLYEKCWKQLLDFYHIWPLSQWISSLVGLVLLYILTGYYYNKWLSDKGGWLDMKTRMALIIFDISFNLVIGIYYMNHRETLLGSIMIRCPVAISPGIFAIELFCFYFYCRYLIPDGKQYFKKPKKQK